MLEREPWGTWGKNNYCYVIIWWNREETTYRKMFLRVNRTCLSTRWVWITYLNDDMIHNKNDERDFVRVALHLLQHMTYPKHWIMCFSGRIEYVGLRDQKRVDDSDERSINHWSFTHILGGIKAWQAFLVVCIYVFESASKKTPMNYTS